MNDFVSGIVRRLTTMQRIFDALYAAGVDMPFETFRKEPLTVEQRKAS